jgi:hypothetical protein
LPIGVVGWCSWRMTERACANGRRRYRSREEAERLAAEFEVSGLTRQEFSKRRDVSVKSLARYLKFFRQWQAEADRTPQWVAVEIAEPDTTPSGLSVVLGGGRRIEVGRGFDPATLQQLVTALERC